MQAEPSSHGVPSWTGTSSQSPDIGLHAGSLQGAASAKQITTVAGSTMHVFFSQTRVPLHASPSSWAAQSASAMHSHVLGPGLQVPDEHRSGPVQVLPSSHGVAVSGSCWQPAAESHASDVQSSPSLQVRAAPLHAPWPSQMSASVQRSPSLQGAPFGAATLVHDPCFGSHG